MTSQRQIKSKNWLQYLFNSSESEILEQLRNGNFDIWKSIVLPAVSPGTFYLPTLGQLKLTWEQSQLRNSPWPTFQIWLRKPDSWDNRMFDTSSLQFRLTSTRPVMYQVASNFNCQEEACEKTKFAQSFLYEGRYLTNLMEDLTQGPAAAGGAGIGAVFRWAINYNEPINLLDQTECVVRNGKLLQVSPNLKEDQIKIGIHTDVSANFDRSSESDTCLFSPKGLFVDQVFASSLALQKEDRCPAAVVTLLTAAYAGTYLAAIYRQTRILVLTLIGGGVFNNPLSVIYSCIAKAHAKYARHSHLETVILPFYSSRIDHRELVSVLVGNGCPKEKIIIKYF